MDKWIVPHEAREEYTNCSDEDCFKLFRGVIWGLVPCRWPGTSSATDLKIIRYSIYRLAKELEDKGEPYWDSLPRDLELSRRAVEKLFAPRLPRGRPHGSTCFAGTDSEADRRINRLISSRGMKESSAIWHVARGITGRPVKTTVERIRRKRRKARQAQDGK